jgi:uncharacterized protein (TIGR03437 family)
MLIRGSLPVVCLGLLSSTLASAQQYTINTLAGNGTAGFLDGSDLSAAQFTSPNAIAIDSKGAVYVADTGGHRIRLISGGAVSTIGGTGTSGYNGSGAAATSANMNSPGGIVVDSSGTIYIAETSNHVVRKISGGNITLVAGSGTAGYGGDGGAANGAVLSGPTGLALDSAGNLYIADTGNNLVRRVTKDGNINQWVGAGATGGRLRNPTGLAINAAGDLYIADAGNRRIAKYSNGQLTNFAGNGNVGFGGDGGPAVNAQFNNPVGVTVDAAGNVYIADANNGRIRKVTTDGNIFTIAGKGGAGYSGDGGDAGAAALNFPRGVAIGPDGKIHIADTGNSVIRVLTATSANSDAVGNSASFVPRISPGALASIFGTGFGSTTAQGNLGLLTNALPTSLNSVAVTVNGVPSPILYLSPTQINFQVPWKTQTGTANVAVTVNGGPTNTVQIAVQTAAPGLFTLPDGSAIVQNADFTLNGADHPVAPGGTILAYLTGSGPIDPALADGTPASTTSLTFIKSATSARIGSSNAAVSFAGLSPGFVGLVQFNIVVPTGLAPGTYPLTVTIDGQTSNSGNIVVK